MKFELTYNLNVIGTYDTFAEAFVKLFTRLNRDLDSGGFTWMQLEQMIWIHPEGWPQPLPFYESRDIAHWMGILDDEGKLNEEYRPTIKPKTYGPPKSVEKTVPCPKCNSEQILSFENFEHVKECEQCGEQFLFRDLIQP